MKKLFFLFVSFCFTSMIFSQKGFTIKGTVTGQDGEPVQFASVALDRAMHGASTGEDGNFLIENVKKGNYVIIVSSIGYQTYKEEIMLDNDQELKVELIRKSYRIEEAQVSAIRAGEEVPITARNIDKEEIEARNISDDMPFLLNMSPSWVATSENGTGMGYTSFRIRGTDATRVNITVNGIPLNDAESQGVFWVNMPDLSASVNQVQIQRGVGTSTNGAASFGASVNIQTLETREEPYAEASATYGSFNTRKMSLSTGIGLIGDRFAFDMRYSKLLSDGYIQRGFSDHHSVYLAGTYKNDKDLLKLIVMKGKERTGITWWGVPDYIIDSIRIFNPAGKYINDSGNVAFYDNQTDNYWQNHYQLFYTRKVSGQLDVNGALHLTTGKGYYEQYIPRVDDFGSTNDFANYGLSPVMFPSDTMLIAGNNTYTFPDSAITATDMIRQKWLDNVFYGANLSANYRMKNLRLSAGVAWNKYEGDHFGELLWTKFNAGIPHGYEWYFNKGIKTDASGFLKANYFLTSKINFYGDIQYRNIVYKMEGPDDDLVRLDQKPEYNFFNPKAGINYKIRPNQRLYASFGMANREPARADLKDATKEGGSQVPKHETLFDYELGYGFKGSFVAANVNFYYMDYKDQLVNTGELNNVGYPVKTNVENSFRTGLEVAASIKPTRYFSWEGNLTLSQNKIKDYTEYAINYDSTWNTETIAINHGTTDISYSPSIIAGSQFSIYPLEGGAVHVISKFVGSQYIDNTSDEDRKLDRYFVTDLRLDYGFDFGKNRELVVQFLVKNILNNLYSNNAYGGNWFEQRNEKSWVYYYPQAGIHYMARVQLNF